MGVWFKPVMTDLNTDFSFDQLPLDARLLTNLSRLGFDQPTAIQAQSLPVILAGQDLIAQSKTGSGKTAAFGLGLLHQLDPKCFDPQALVLCPTRELADQVAAEIRRLARLIPNIKILTLCGGSPIGPQLSSLAQGAHIIVGTPGRIDDHLRKQSLNLKAITSLVLDEADRMLAMGFKPTIDSILATITQPHQTLLFSATFPDAIAQMTQELMVKPRHIQVATDHDQSSIQHIFYLVNTPEDRLSAVRSLLLAHRPNASMVFCNTKKDAQFVADSLVNDGFSAQALHGDLEQKERDQTLIQFAHHSIAVLVATDVAARGIDIAALDMVINFHIAHDPEIHVHRIGRTGRAGQSGLAASLISDKEAYKITVLSDYLGQSITPEALPDRSKLNPTPLQASMVTLLIDGGKKDKVRPGDILGAMTAHPDLSRDDMGKITITDLRSYVAVTPAKARLALGHLSQNKLKGKNLRVRRLSR